MTGSSDRPIVLPPDANTYHDTFEAKYVTWYIEDYVDVHVYDGKSLRERVIFGFKVSRIEEVDGEWWVRSEGDDDGEKERRIIKSKKLAVAIGQNSLPYTPAFPNQANFKSPIIHQKNFGQIAISALASDSPYTSITVLGGCKSAVDMVYECAKAGKEEIGRRSRHLRRCQRTWPVPKWSRDVHHSSFCCFESLLFYISDMRV